MFLVPGRPRSLRRSVVARLVAVVGLFGMASFVLVGAAEIWHERSELLRAEHERARAAVATSAGGVALAMWTFDQKALEITAASLTREGPIVQVDVVADGQVVLSQRRNGAAPPTSSWSLPLRLADRVQPIGELRVSESYEEVDAQILQRAWRRLGLELGKVAGITLGVFLLLHYLVMRRLGRLAQRLQVLPPDDPPAALRILADEGERDDEIAAVAQAVLQFQHDRAAEARRRELAETHLRERMDEMAVTLGALGEGVIVLDAQMRLRYANATAQRMTGVPAACDALSLQDLCFTHADGGPIDLAGRVATSRDAEHAVDLHDDLRLQPLQTADAAPLQVRVQIIPLRSSEELAWVLVIHDQSEAVRLRESERARALAEGASRAKSEFLSRMSHELRTPLNAIVGFAQSLEQDPAVTGDLRRAERVRLIVRAGWHLTGMIGDVLDLSRIESGNVNVTLGPVDLPALLQEVMALMAGQAEPEGVSLYLASLGGVRYVEADATRLRQVLVNLLSNAIKYNRSGGAVMTGAAVTADGEVAISLQDTGIGMTSAQLAALYQPFNRLGREATGRPGTGIGLVITKKLVEMMRGRIEVSSVPGEGTRFVVTLRGAQAPAAVPTMPAPLGAPSEMGPRRVMYIEDDPVNAEVMRALLSLRPRVSLSVHTTLLEGLAALRSAPPDLLLLDMQLPDGSGLELLRALADDPLLATVPVVMVSADVMEDSIGAALQAGARAYIAKPFNFDEVLKQLDAVLALTT